MTEKEQLLREIEQAPDSLVSEVLNFLRSTKTKLDQPAIAKQLRPIGLCAGEFTVPDDFDDPLPAEILELFGKR